MENNTAGQTSDLLYGSEAIAGYLGLTHRQVLHCHEKRELPTFKQGRIVCARRSTLDKHFADLEAKAAGR